MNIFQKFHGGYLARLIKCLKLVEAAGLTVTEHTRAGINAQSGNVWVWDEDWVASAYCTVYDYSAWHYDCRECGEYFDFQTYSEAEAYARDYEGGCAYCEDKITANE